MKNDTGALCGLRAIAKIALLGASLITTSSYATSLHQECDGEKKTCCVSPEMGAAPPMWVNAATCPKGMIDDSTCVIQYGCTTSEPSS